MKIEAFTSTSYMFAIAHSYNVLWRGFNQRLKKSGCNINEALVLIALYFEENASVTPSMLATALRTSRGNISHCLSNLDSRKLLKRTLFEQDARRLIISLTAAGKKLAEGLIASFEELEGKCERHFSQQKTAKNIIERLYSLQP